MTGHTAWPHLLADLTAKRDALTEIIHKLTTLFIDDEDLDASDVVDQRVNGHRTKTRRPKARPRTAPATHRRTRRAPAPADRAAVVDEDRRRKILTLLAEGPLATREVATRLRLDRLLVKMTLQRMKKVGLIASVGVTNGQRWTVPPSGPKAAPASASVLRAHDVSKTDLASVEARDAAILKYLRNHDGVASTEQLKSALPKEPALTADQFGAALHAALVRIKAKGLIGRTGDTWSLVGVGSRAANG